MIGFDSDYLEGGHPKILEMLTKTNMEQTIGYGEDKYCQKAKEIIAKKCGNESVDVQFMMGGTQANMTVIKAALRPHEGVISVVEGHINTHEAGAIEASGHKVLAVDSGGDGKLSAEQISKLVLQHKNDDSQKHIVKPKMVYISNPTELGTLYSKKELEQISEVCKEHNLYLFLDGARLGYGMASKDNDLDLPFITKCCDVFYIGGTKIGALFGEAIVIKNDAIKEDFRYIMKQNGGVLAKGRLLGLQFIALFEDDLYFRIAKHAIDMAEKLKDGFISLGLKFQCDSSTNQQFVILENDVLDKLKEKYNFRVSDRINENESVVRFCTSWATKEENVDKLLSDLKIYLNK